jgi:hypothetical protein
MSSSNDILSEDLLAKHNMLERSFRSGYRKFTEGANEMALSLHRMQVHGTWRVARDDHGDRFRVWTDYVVWLADDVGLGRSTMFSYKSAVEFARINSFTVDEEGLLDHDQFIERGGVLTFRRIKERTVTSRNGKIISIKGTHAKNPKEVIQEVVETIDPDMRPMDQVRFIKEVIAKETGNENKVEINLRLRPSEEGGYHLVWTKESNVGLEEGLVMFPAPDDVLDKLKTDFHILA